MLLFILIFGLVSPIFLFCVRLWLGPDVVISVVLPIFVFQIFTILFKFSVICVGGFSIIVPLVNILPNVFGLSSRFILILDDLSFFFLMLLCLALGMCLFFLSEYFEFDSNATSIILLSVMFSNSVMWYFCCGDILMLVVFWEIINLISFFLVQYWFIRVPSYKASLKVFIISQLSDLPIIAFASLSLSIFRDSSIFIFNSCIHMLVFDFVIISNLDIFIAVNLVTLLSFCLGFAALLKGAQLFFYPWLLDAMEAPVPISSQLHSSTLVIIGFFLIFRFLPLFHSNSSIMFTFIFFGALTVLGMSILALYQIDGKKLLACSTSSQLGYIFIGIGLGLYTESLIMLFFICLLKAITFIWFGLIMDNYGGLSDFRQIGGSGYTNLLEFSVIVSVITIVLPVFGSSVWFIKLLYNSGFSSYLSLLGYGVLQLTWVFGSLYLIYFIFSLFNGNHRYTLHLYPLLNFTTKGYHTLYQLSRLQFKGDSSSYFINKSLFSIQPAPSLLWLSSCVLIFILASPLLTLIFIC